MLVLMKLLHALSAAAIIVMSAVPAVLNVTKWFVVRVATIVEMGIVRNRFVTIVDMYVMIVDTTSVRDACLYIDLLTATIAQIVWKNSKTK